MNILKSFFCFTLFCLCFLSGKSQFVGNQTILPDDSVLGSPSDNVALLDSIVYESLTDSLLMNVVDVDTLVSFKPLPKSFLLMPPIFVSFLIPDEKDKEWLFTPEYSGNEAFKWLEDEASVDKRKSMMMQYLAVHSPFAIDYNIGMLPEAPKKYDVVINPDDYTINVVEVVQLDESDVNIMGPEIGKKHWLKTFNASLQFSQAYVSPNWYQGGNNNLNMLLNLNYNVKLNQKFHPNYLFETNVAYKLGLNSAPDDTLRSYNISEDIFQVNTTFGYKAIKNWYYTFTGQFKTQLFNSYTKSTNNLRAALLSPGELNAGIGMTYNTTNKKKTITFDASISPLSYNLMICTNGKMNPAAFNIEPGHKSASNYGSSVECKLSWKICNNISLQSRLFAFTDYDRGYADLENTMVFEINKYLTTQIYAHLRYDSHTPFIEEGWHKLQVKEILSMGFAYKFSTI